MPTAFYGMLRDPDPGRSERVMQALLRMTKLDIGTREAAYQGRPGA